MSKKSDELVYKFIDTGEEKYFNQLIKKYEHIIRHKVNIKVPNRYDKDFGFIVNRVRIRLWEALKRSYNPNKSKPSTFINAVIEKAIQGYLQRQGRHKRYINNYSDSLDKTIYESDGREVKGYDYLSAKNNPAKETIDKITYQQFINKLYNKMSDMEKKVFNVIKYYPGNGRFQDSIYYKIIEETGLTYNQIDNALYRIRNKARVLNDYLEFGKDDKYKKYTYGRG